MGYFYLVLAIIFNCAWALSYKVAVRRKCNLNSVNLFVQIGAMLVMLVLWGATSPTSYHPKVAIIGIVMGLLAALSVITFFHHIKTGVLAVSWTVIGLAIVFPVAASILLWHERLTPQKIVGLALIPVVFLCFGSNGKTEKSS